MRNFELTPDQRRELQSLAYSAVWMNSIVDDAQALKDAVSERATDWGRALVESEFNTDGTLPEDVIWELEDHLREVILGAYEWEYCVALVTKTTSQARYAPKDSETAAQADAAADADAVPPELDPVDMNNGCFS